MVCPNLTIKILYDTIGYIQTLEDLIMEIESRVKAIVDKKYPKNDIYFNYMDSQFTGTHEKALALADKLFQ